MARSQYPASCHFWTEPSVGLVPRSPSHSEHKAGQHRHPPSPGHLGSGWCLDTRAGGRGDLHLPEDRGRSHCPLRALWAVGGAWVPASLELICQAVWPRKPLSSRPSPGLRAQHLPFEAGSCGRSTAGLGELAWTSRCQTSQVSFERLHATGLSFRLQFQEKAPAQAENEPWFTL